MKMCAFYAIQSFLLTFFGKISAHQILETFEEVLRQSILIRNILFLQNTLRPLKDSRKYRKRDIWLGANEVGNCLVGGTSEAWST